MTRSSLKTVGFMIATFAMSIVVCAQPPAEPSETAGEKQSAEESEAIDAKRVSLEVARDRAALMHDIYEATLDVMHHRYFHADRSIVPARAMEDVFAEIQQTSATEARWISVNLKPMSLDHKPETDFEKQAAKTLATGEPEVEIVEDGYYRRATPIPLSGGCISCHSGLFSQPSEKPKYAGLVISIPVHRDVSQPDAASEDR